MKTSFFGLAPLQYLTLSLSFPPPPMLSFSFAFSRLASTRFADTQHFGLT